MGAVKRVIQFNDLDGNPVEEVYYFQLGKTDALETDVIHEHKDDMEEYVRELAKGKNSRELVKVWQQLLFTAVGQRVGNQLIKSPEITAQFRFGGAYEQFFSELMESEDGGGEFFMKIMPEDVQERSEEAAKRVYTKEELLDMPDAEFDRIAGTDESKMSREHLLIAFQRKSQGGSKAA